MKLTETMIVVGLAIALTTTSSQADESQASHRSKAKHAHGMQAVTNQATAGQLGYRWQYFAEPSKHRAVVISPSGDYFYSHGDGLVLVHKGAQGTQAS